MPLAGDTGKGTGVQDTDGVGKNSYTKVNSSLDSGIFPLTLMFEEC